MIFPKWVRFSVFIVVNPPEFSQVFFATEISGSFTFEISELSWCFIDIFTPMEHCSLSSAGIWFLKSLFSNPLPVTSVPLYGGKALLSPLSLPVAASLPSLSYSDITHGRDPSALFRCYTIQIYSTCTRNYTNSLIYVKLIIKYFL